MSSKLFLRHLLAKSKVKVPQLARKIQFGLHTSSVPVREIEIPTEWGHVSAKLWGDENRQPILALHGWQDNAGTWDPLAPMLAKGCSILAIDFLGHGKSSWLPPGAMYHMWDLPCFIKYLQEHFKWEKLNLLCHSMGSIAASRYASLFPEAINSYIAIDSLISDDYYLEVEIEKYRKNIQKLHVEIKRHGSEPPSYTFENMKEIWHKGTSKSVGFDATEYLLKRGSKPSKSDPSKFYFSRDPRLKYVLFSMEDKKFVEALLKRINFPVLYMKAIDSPYGVDAYSIEMREVLEHNNPEYEFHYVPGTHHVHLNNPETVFPIIKSFLEKHNLYHES